MADSWRTWMVTLLIALAATAGCGGDGEDSGSEPAGEEIKTHEFRAAFEKEAGVKLQIKDSHSWWTGLDARGDDKASREYGTFTVFLLSNVEKGLEAKTTGDSGERLDRDEDGIYWWLHTVPPRAGSYTAIKRFGNNVVVHWSAGKAKRTDDRWDRLVPKVEKAVDSAGS